MSAMEQDFEAQAMLDDLRTGYGDQKPVAEQPVPAVNPRMRDWKRRSEAAKPR